MDTAKLEHARELASKLRRGIPISFCDHMIANRDGKIVESWMTYDSYTQSHEFAERVLTFAEIRRSLTCGAFR